MSSMDKSPQSPCVSVCSLDHFDVCVGCFRSGEEIVDWFSADDDRKLEILDSCGARRKEFFSQSPSSEKS